MTDLQPGDVFATLNPRLVGRMIRAVTQWWSKDGQSEFGHAGIIVNANGTTIEALWHTQYNHLDKYIGKNIIIARPTHTLAGKEISPDMHEAALAQIVKDHLQQHYPWWRIPFHLIPPLARLWASGNHLVCSELVAKYLCLIGARGNVYVGINPDDLADNWTYWRNFEVLYKGVWK